MYHYNIIELFERIVKSSSQQTKYICMYVTEDLSNHLDLATVADRVDSHQAKASGGV